MTTWQGPWHPSSSGCCRPVDGRQTASGARLFAVVELDHSRDKVQHLGRNRLVTQNARHDGIGHRRFQMVGVVAKMQVSRRTLMESVDQFAQLAAAKPALFPPLERFSDRQKSTPQFLLMRRGRAVADKPFDSL